MLTIYKASAGSGKTFTLALQYIRMLLGVKTESGKYVLNHKRHLGRAPLKGRHSRILAVTFTNKATAEMKQRILGDLDKLSHVPEPGTKDSAYAPILMKEFGCSREELAEVAMQSFHALLDDYGSFNVSTIDTFFQTILRSFAREIERQGDFKLEMSPRTVVAQALALLFDDLNICHSEARTKRLRDWLLNLSGRQIRQGADFNPFNRTSPVFKDIRQYVEQSFDEDFQQVRGEVEEYLSDPGRLDRFDAWLDAEIERLDDKMRAAARNVLDSAGEKLNKHPLAFFNNIAAGKIPDNLGGTTGYLCAIRAGEIKGVFPAKSKDAESLIGGLTEALAIIEKAYCTLQSYQEIRKSTDGLWALGFIRDFIERYRQENNLIMLADTNTLLGSIISENDAPFIYEKVGVELDSFLIDEFQDTSRMQWTNFRPLLANALATDGDSLIIGDVKQSIYRWRGGDSAMLDHGVEADDFPAPRSAVKGAGEGENSNYRSAPALVKFNNTLFHTIAERHDVKGYAGVAQTPAKSPDFDARINVSLFNSPGSELSKQRFAPETTTETGTPLVSLNPVDQSFALAASHILEQHSQGYSFGEIAVLFRENKETARFIQFVQKEYPSIPTVSDEGLLLVASPAVRIIVSMLEIIDKGLYGNAHAEDAAAPDDPAARKLRERLETRRRQERLKNMFNYRLAHGAHVTEALLAALEDSASGGSTSEIDNDLDYLRELAPSSLTAMIEAIIGLKVSPEQRAHENAYITSFVDLAADYAANHTPTVHSFLSYWNDMKSKLSVSAPGDVNAVAVMTVHKAKGLEWDCVHVPKMDFNFADFKMTPSFWIPLKDLKGVDPEIVPPTIYVRKWKGIDSEWSPFGAFYADYVAAEKADNLNLAYVAFTRAKRELDINITSRTNKGDGKGEKKESGKGDGMMEHVIIDALATSRPDSDIYCDFGNMTDKNGEIHFGSPTVPVRDKNEEGQPEIVSAAPFNVTFSAVNSRYTRLEDLTMLDNPADDPAIGNEAERDIVDKLSPDASLAMEAAARKGLVLHAILSELYTLDDIEGTAARHVRFVENMDAASLAAEVRAAFDLTGPAATRWFEPTAEKVLTEQAIYDSKENMTRRVDRLVFNRDGSIDVIDYKFTTRELPSHRRQVKEYVGLISSIYPGRTINAWLWYPQEGKIVEVGSF